MKQFCKLYEHPEIGQILVKMDTDDDGAPEVRFHFIPDGLGVCAFALGFPDTDAGYELQEKAFEKIGELDAIAAVRSILAMEATKALASTAE